MTSTEPYVVRAAERHELTAAVDCWRAANPGSRLAGHPDRLLAWASQAGAWVAVAECGGRIVGMTLAALERADDGDGEVVPGVIHLTGVAVRPEHQGRGVGGRILDQVLARAADQDHRRARLWTRLTNDAALRLFGSRGFAPTGRTSTLRDGEVYVHLESVLAAGEHGSPPVR